MGRKPEGAEKDDPRSGEPGPVTLEALAIAASYEKDKADQLAYDATADPDFYPGASKSSRNVVFNKWTSLLTHTSRLYKRKSLCRRALPGPIFFCVSEPKLFASLGMAQGQDLHALKKRTICRLD